MNLIAKNKIAEYIGKHPEARVDLLTWLEEYPYREGKEPLSGYKDKDMVHAGCGSGSSSPGSGDYVIKYRINYDAKIHCITWVGTKEQIVQEFKATREVNPALKEQIVIEQVFSAPPPQNHDGIKEWTKSKTQKTQIAVISGKGSLDEKINLKEAEYEKELARAIALLEARPNTPEFFELLDLLPLINSYEAYKLKFPPIYAFEIVTLRMNLFELTPLNLATMLGRSENELKLFLSGEVMLRDEILAELYKILSLHIPINNPHFIQ